MRYGLTGARFSGEWSWKLLGLSYTPSSSNWGGIHLRATLLATLVAVLGGCTWVSLTPQGEGVRVLESAEAGCAKVGQVSSNTTDVVVFRRNQEKVAKELRTLARNEAADLGGNAILATGEPSAGRQSFDVYRCPSP